MAVTFALTDFFDKPSTAGPESAPRLNQILTALRTVCGSGAGSGLEADTVPGYGIGVLSPALASFSASLVSGLYKYAGSTTGAPTGNAGLVLVLAGSSNDSFFVFDIGNYFTYAGVRAHGSGSITWQTLWSAYSDGNGGQAPAPKPKVYSSGAMAEWYLLASGSGNALVLPAGGTWAWSATKFVDASGTLTALGADVSAGGATVGSATAGQQWKGVIWRIA